MKRSIVGLILVTAISNLALAGNGVPDPSRSTVEYSGASTPCHYKFVADGSEDALVVDVTVLDAFDTPVAMCDVEVSIVPTSGTVALGSCCPLVQVGESGPAGEVQFQFDAISGRGEFDVETRVLCVGGVLIGLETFTFTSTDLNAGDVHAVGITNVFDLGVFAGGLGSTLPLIPPALYSNYDCNDAIDIFDLGFFARGLAVDCADAVCP